MLKFLKLSLIALCCAVMQIHSLAQNVTCETDSVEYFYYQKTGFVMYSGSPAKSAVLGATREGHRSRFVTTESAKTKKGYEIPALTKYLSADDLKGFFTPVEVKSNIPAGKFSYRQFNTLSDYKMGKVRQHAENKDSLVFSSNNLLENAYGQFSDFGLLDETSSFFVDQRKHFGIVLTVHRINIDEYSKLGYVSANAYVTIEMRDAYNFKLYEKELEVKSNTLPRSFLQNSFFWNYWAGVVNGEEGMRIWSDLMEEAYLQFFHSPEVAMIIEAWSTRCASPVSEDVLSINKSTNTSGTPAATTKAVVTIKTKEGHGSGCLISKDGYLITNYHVVGGSSDSLKVVLNDGTEYSGKVVRTDPGMDLALVKIEGSNFQSISPSFNPNCKLGDVIYVIGTPADPSLGQTITKGIFSAKRDVYGNTMYQTDAHVNPGNSGGGMFNEKGELVGIVSSKGSGNVVEGLGFAIPSNYIFERLKIKYQ